MGLGAGLIAGLNAFTAASSGSFIGDTPKEILRPIREGESVSLEQFAPGRFTLASFQDEGDEPEGAQSSEPSGPIVTHGWSRRIVNFWTGALELLIGALLTSFYFTASTLLYLLLRRICDGQDVAELWTPAPE